MALWQTVHLIRGNNNSIRLCEYWNFNVNDEEHTRPATSRPVGGPEKRRWSTILMVIRYIGMMEISRRLQAIHATEIHNLMREETNSVLMLKSCCCCWFAYAHTCGGRVCCAYLHICNNQASKQFIIWIPNNLDYMKCIFSSLNDHLFCCWRRWRSNITTHSSLNFFFDYIDTPCCHKCVSERNIYAREWLRNWLWQQLRGLNIVGPGWRRRVQFPRLTDGDRPRRPIRPRTTG